MTLGWARWPAPRAATARPRRPPPGCAHWSGAAPPNGPIAQSHADDFYQGELAARIARFAAETGGYLTAADLAAHTSTWVEPLSTSYRGYDVWEIPPNGQGISALAALNILEGCDVRAHPRESTESYHLQIEAMKLAFVDALRYVANHPAV